MKNGITSFPSNFLHMEKTYLKKNDFFFFKYYKLRNISKKYI